MQRAERILEHVDETRRGVEIGPSHAPIAPKREGYRVDVIDHLDREGLIEKYRHHGVDLDAIEDVDFVSSGQGYAELTGRPNGYGWVIASHVIEHAPSLVAFLNECDSLLADDGVLALAVPDKRRCFDVLRPLSGLAGVLDAHFTGRTVPSPGAVAEHLLNAAFKDGAMGWTKDTRGDLELVHDLDAARRGVASAQGGDYVDVHVWCFTPTSFRLIVHDLNALGLCPLREVSFHATDGHEFFVSLSRSGAGVSESRLELLARVQAELAEAVT